MQSNDDPLIIAGGDECRLSLSALTDVLTTAHIEVASLSRFAKGWDYNVYLLNESEILRVPRRKGVADRLREEIRLLKLIRDNPWVCVPNYQIIFEPDVGVELIAGYPVIKGKALCTQADAAKYFPAIVKFLSWLHGIHEEHNIELGNATNLPRYRETAKRAFLTIQPRLKSHECSLFERALSRDLPNLQPAVVIHNDLRPDHILTMPDKVAIIDWTDIAWACPWEEFFWLWICWGDDIFRGLRKYYEGWQDEWIDYIRTVGTWKIALEYYYGLNTSDDAKLRVAELALKRIT